MCIIRWQMPLQVTYNNFERMVSRNISATHARQQQNYSVTFNSNLLTRSRLFLQPMIWWTDIKFTLIFCIESYRITLLVWLFLVGWYHSHGLLCQSSFNSVPGFYIYSSTCKFVIAYIFFAYINK